MLWAGVRGEVCPPTAIAKKPHPLTLIPPLCPLPSCIPSVALRVEPANPKVSHAPAGSYPLSCNSWRRSS